MAADRKLLCQGPDCGDPRVRAGGLHQCRTNDDTLDNLSHFSGLGAGTDTKADRQGQICVATNSFDKSKADPAAVRRAHR